MSDAEDELGVTEVPSPWQTTYTLYELAEIMVAFTRVPGWGSRLEQLNTLYIDTMRSIEKEIEELDNKVGEEEIELHDSAIQVPLLVGKMLEEVTRNMDMHDNFDEIVANFGDEE